jgi:hypothetical protein
MVSLEYRCGRFSSSLYVCNCFSFLVRCYCFFFQGSSGIDKGGTGSTRSPQEGQPKKTFLLFTILDLSILLFRLRIYFRHISHEKHVLSFLSLSPKLRCITSCGSPPLFCFLEACYVKPSSSSEFRHTVNFEEVACFLPRFVTVVSALCVC